MIFIVILCLLLMVYAIIADTYDRRFEIIKSIKENDQTIITDTIVRLLFLVLFLFCSFKLLTIDL